MERELYDDLKRAQYDFLDSAIKTIEERLSAMPQKVQKEHLSPTGRDDMPYAALNELYAVRDSMRKGLIDPILPPESEI